MHTQNPNLTLLPQAFTTLALVLNTMLLLPLQLRSLSNLLSCLILNKVSFYRKVYRMVYRCCFSNRCSSTGLS